MDPLTLDPGPGIPHGLVIPAADLREQFARSSGPGGQSVNTTDSRVRLSLDLATATGLNERQRRRAMENLRPRLAGTVLQVEASARRSQFRNRSDARRRLAAVLREALAPPPPPRRATRPTRGSVRRRLEEKRRRSDLKAARRRPDRSGD